MTTSSSCFLTQSAIKCGLIAHRNVGPLRSVLAPTSRLSAAPIPISDGRNKTDCRRSDFTPWPLFTSATDHSANDVISRSLIHTQVGSQPRTPSSGPHTVRRHSRLFALKPRPALRFRSSAFPSDSRVTPITRRPHQKTTPIHSRSQEPTRWQPPSVSQRFTPLP